MADVYLIRNSLTEGEASEAPVAHRHLSLEGRQLIRAMGQKVRLAEEPSFDRFITSALAPAVQTAELFADRVDYIGAIEVMPALAASIPPQIAAAQILARGSIVAVFADEPELSALGAFLIGRPTFPLLVHAQVSVITDRKPAWYLRPDTMARGPLLVA
ncbi:hypothetical protein BH09MYX1_BH09MYX1_07030 [soil metagenome]